MKQQEIIKRYALFIVSLFFIGVGIALTKRADIGISPISSVANVVSMRFTFFSFGTWSIVSNMVFLLGQIVILRRRFQPIQLLQIPLSFLFGYFTDLGIWLTQFLPQDSYAMKLLLVAVGCVILGFGISLGVIANVILNSPEAFVRAVADTLKKKFGSIKIIFDVSLVTISGVLSLIFFSGELIGVREGTVITAVSVGYIVNLFCRFLKKPLTRLLTADKASTDAVQ